MNKKIIIPFVALAVLIPTMLIPFMNEQPHDNDRLYMHSSGIFANISEDGLAETADYILEGTLVKAKSI